MKSLLTLSLAITLCGSARAAIIGGEDIRAMPTSDRDFNDRMATIAGVDFHLTGIYTFVPPVGYSETPLPDGYFFDYGIATSPIIAINAGSQSDAHDVLMLKVGAGSWLDIPETGSLEIDADLGATVLFAIRTPFETFYGDRSLNGDGLWHLAVTGIDPPSDFPGGPEVPEPGTLALIGTALCGLGLFRKRVKVRGKLFLVR